MTQGQRLLCWSAFVLGGLGWAMSSQVGAMRVSDDCLSAHVWLILTSGAAGLIAALAGTYLSWLGLRAARRPADIFIARISLAACAAFALAVSFHTLAPLLIPRCAV
jgi:hypothetical protein